MTAIFLNATGIASTDELVIFSNDGVKEFFVFGDGTFEAVGPALELSVKGKLQTLLSGTVSVTINTAAVTGSSTFFTTELAVGSAIEIGGEIFTVSAIADNTNLTLDSNHSAGASAVTAKTDGDLLSIQTGDSQTKIVVDNAGDMVLNTYTNSTKPAAGTVGKVFFNTTTRTLSFDDGSLLLNGLSISAIKTSAYTAVLNEVVRVNPTSGGFTVTLPSAASSEGTRVVVKNASDSTNNVVIDGDGSETIDDNADVTLNTARGSVTFISDGTNWLII